VLAAQVTMEPLYRFSQPFVGATITARPSRHNKSPYLVDCSLDDGQEVIVHNPALKCNGLVGPGARVWLQPAASSSALSKYVLYLLETDGHLVCIHPTIANTICSALICRGKVAPFIEKVRPEVIYKCQPDTDKCRFDFYGVRDGRDTYIEVKSASMAVDGTAVFPYGNGRSQGIVSERALKHVQGLASAAASGADAYLVYISMRPDVESLKISERDPVYRKAVFEAASAGVQVRAFACYWTTDGDCWFKRSLTVL
jgi:DNA-binding sugar fermentation-stimulating protein